MMLRKWSLTQRLWSIVAVTFASLAAMMIADGASTAILTDRLDGIEDGYVPLLRYGPRVKTAFDRLRQAMQDAVAAQDPEALAETIHLEQDVLALLNNAPSVIAPIAMQELTESFLEWRSKAYGVSLELLERPAGEVVVQNIEAMQTAQRETWSVLQRSVFLDEAALSRAFGDIHRAQQAAATKRVIFHVALLLIIALMMLLLARRVLHSFGELRAGFLRFGRGDFSQPVAIVGADELADLSTSANTMANRIEELQNGLRDKQSELEQANRELEAFSYSVSHDLRAPLRGIDGFSQALLEDCADQLDATGKDYLARVRAAAQRMGDLIDDLLSLAKIGRAQLRKTHVDATALATRVVQTLQQTDPSRTIEWVIAPNVEVWADPGLLSVVLDNLLGNAWKFTSKLSHGRIEWGAMQSGGENIYFVRDNGAGFDMTYSHKLFGAFQRLHGVTDFQGTGIGLATVNRIIRKHGGRVWAEGHVNAGATFFFTLSQMEST